MDEVKVPTADLGDAHLESPARRLLIFSLAIAILIADFWVIDLAGQLRDRVHLPISDDWNQFGKPKDYPAQGLVGSFASWWFDAAKTAKLEAARSKN